VRRRPTLAASRDRTRRCGTVFGEQLVLVEDGPGVAPDLRIVGELSDVVSMMVAPLLGGVPNPVRPRGRSALGKVMLGRLRVEGRTTADAPAAGDHPTELRIKPGNRPRRSACIWPGGVASPTRRSTDPEAYA
jgi:hypothetical protein